MIRSLSNTPVHSLFSPETNVVYSVPKYQREYSWGISQWDNLFDDLLEAGHQGEHFLGTIICVNNTRDTTEESILEVIDSLKLTCGFPVTTLILNSLLSRSV